MHIVHAFPSYIKDHYRKENQFTFTNDFKNSTSASVGRWQISYKFGLYTFTLKDVIGSRKAISELQQYYCAALVPTDIAPKKNTQTMQT